MEDVGGPETRAIRIPAAECWVLSETVVLRLKQAATWTKDPAASPTGACMWVIDPQSGRYVQGAAQPAS